MSKKLIIKNVTNQEDLIGIFSSEQIPSVCLSTDQLRHINASLSDLIDKLLPSYIENFPAAYNKNKYDIEAISRVTLLSTLALYFDRLIRISHLISANRDLTSILHYNCEEINVIDCLDLSDKSANSFIFNQQIVCHLAEIFDLKKIKLTPPLENQSQIINFRNNMFYLARPSKLKTLCRLLKKESSKITGKIGAYELTQTLIPSLDKNLFGFRKLAHINSLNIELTEINSNFNSSIRNFFISTFIKKNLLNIDNFLKKNSLEINFDKLIKNLVDFLIKYIPKSSIESHFFYVKKYDDLIKTRNLRAVYSTNFGQSIDSLALITAAKINRIKVIGSQHGGHHGYIDNHIIGKECEYKIVDNYIVWGWVNYSEGIIDRNKVMSMPSPWLSERLKEWNALNAFKLVYEGEKDFDFIFMPNKIYPYTPAPTGAHLTGNHLYEYSCFFKKLVSTIADEKLKILHKPYGQSTVNVMAETVCFLNKKYPNFFYTELNLEKGININYVRKANAFLWDQPGTGFLECLVLNIPTFVIWTNIYNEPENNSKPLFNDLINQDIIHKNIGTLINSYKNFLKNRNNWWNDDRRQNAIRNFVRAYGANDDQWHLIWEKELIKKIIDE